MNDLQRNYCGKTMYRQFHGEPIENYHEKMNKKKSTIQLKVLVTLCRKCGLRIRKSTAGEVTPSTENQDNDTLIKTEEKNLDKANVDLKEFTPTVVKIGALLAAKYKERYCQCGKIRPIIVPNIIISSKLVENSDKNTTERNRKTKRRSNNNTPILNKSTESVVQQSEIERDDFKTKATHRYLKEYSDIIPDLRHAIRQGRRHNFFGYDGSIFRN